MVEGRDSAVDLELEREEADRALRDMAAGLSASAGPAVRARLLAAAPALAEVFPWLPSALGAPTPGADGASGSGSGGAPGGPGPGPAGSASGPGGRDPGTGGPPAAPGAPGR